LNERALKFVERKHEKPFVLYLAHKAVHGPFTPAERHKNLFENPKFKMPPSLHDSLEGKPVLTRKVEPRPGQKKKLKASVSENDGNPSGKFAMHAARSQLQDMVSVDEGVGAIYDALKKNGQLDNTIFIFSSDNGYFWGEHGLADKRWAYEESIRDPLLVRYPKLVKAGTVIHQLVMNIDIAPTLLELGGAKIPANIQGRSFVPLLKGDSTNWRDSMLLEYFEEKNYPRMPSWHAVRTERWKYIRYTELPGMDELYDLQNDPYEMTNLIHDASSQSELKTLQSSLQQLEEKF
jgi:N-acetylglucosamine-6-sulfatase